VQAAKFSILAALAVTLALSGCATAPTSQDSAAPAGTYNPGGAVASAVSSVAQRDLTPQEKKVIVDSVSQSLRDPASAKYKWAKFPVVVTEDSVNYCATVNGKSPFPAYSGEQAYIIEARVVGGKVTSAVMGLIAGGKDFALVSTMCAKYGLDPRKAS
jgi:hypothetical protein